MNFLQEIFGWIAFILNIIFYIIPIPHFIKVIQGKINFEDTPGVYVTTCYMNTFVWFIYGEMTSSDQIKVSNMLASIISFTFIMIYLLYELKKYFVDSVLNFLILISGSWAVYRALTIVVDDDITCGYIGIGTTVIVLISPLVILYKVCKEKNYHLIQVFSAFIYSLNSIFFPSLFCLLKELMLTLTPAADKKHYLRNYPNITVNQKVWIEALWGDVDKDDFLMLAKNTKEAGSL